MNIQINIDSNDLEMIIAMIRASDPIGFFAGKLSNNLTIQLQSQVKNTDRFINNEQVDFIEKKNN
jgi:DNA-directed RNA polymerase specialized sigma54-like protein